VKRSFYLVTALVLAAVAVFVARRDRPRAALQLAPIEKSALVRGQVPIWEEAFVPSPDFEHVAWAGSDTPGRTHRGRWRARQGVRRDPHDVWQGRGRAVPAAARRLRAAKRPLRLRGQKWRGALALGWVDGAEEGNWDRLGISSFSSDASAMRIASSERVGAGSRSAERNRPYDRSGAVPSTSG